MPETLDRNTAATGARAVAAGGASPLADMVRSIRTQLGPTSARRVGLPHATVLRTLMDTEEDFSDVIAIYKTLLAQGNPMVMSKLYRVLKVLEEARAIERHWAQHEGRPRSVYCVAGRAKQGGHDHASGACKFCGVLHD